MVSRRLQPVDLAVQHVGDGGQRMPVGGMDMGERPGNARDGEPPRHLGAVADVFRVVIINELVRQGLPENDPDQRGD